LGLGCWGGGKFFSGGEGVEAQRDRPLDGWVDLALRLGEANLVALELPDRGNTNVIENPTPTPISLDPAPGKALLLSGHDLLQLRRLAVFWGFNDIP